MMRRADRSKLPYLCTYKGFQLLLTHGRVYGLPAFLDPEEVLRRGWLASHPAILSASTRKELEALIDSFDVRRHQPELIGSYQGYNLLRHRGTIYGVPQGAGLVDLDLEEDRRRRGVLGGKTPEQVQERIR